MHTAETLSCCSTRPDALGHFRCRLHSAKHEQSYASVDADGLHQAQLFYPGVELSVLFQMGSYALCNLATEGLSQNLYAAPAYGDIGQGLEQSFSQWLKSFHGALFP